MGKYQEMLTPQAEQTNKYAQMIHGESPQSQAVTPEQFGVQFDPEKRASTGTLAVSSLADDPKYKMAYFAAKRFPNLPPEEALKRYKILGGTIAYQDDSGQWFAETAKGFSPKSMIDRVAAHLSKAIPLGAEIATGVATTPLMMTGGGAAASIGATSAAAGAGEAFRQLLGKVLTGDPISTGEIAGEAAMAATGQGLAKAGTVVAGRHMARDIKRLDPKMAGQLQQKAQREGIQLTPAETTNLSSLKGQQRALGSLPYSSDILEDFVQKRAGQVESAVYNQLDKISPIDSGEVVGELARSASRNAMKDVAESRAVMASPLYNKAFSQKPQVDVTEVMGFLSREGTKAKGGIKSAIEKAQDLLTFKAEGKTYMETDLETLHQAKMALDDMIGTARQTGMGNTAKGKLVAVKNKLLSAMDNASPDYRQARQIFADLSPEVGSVREGVVGIIADLPDSKLQQAAAKIFNPAVSGPKTIRQARIWINAADPNAWQGLKRAYLQDSFEKAGREYATGGGKTLQGAKFRALVFGDVKRREMLKEALTPDEYRSMSDLMDVLEATGRAVDTNSKTAWRMEEIAELKRMGVNVGPGSLEIHMVLNNVADWWRQVQLGNYSEKLANIITSPDGIKNLRALRQVSPRSAKAMVISAHALGLLGSETLSQQ